MGILETILPATTSIAVHGSQQAPQARSDASAQNAAVQQAVTSGQATVVSLSTSNPKRIATHGERRSVDAAFEKQEAKEAVEKKVEKDKKSAGGAVDVSA